MEWGDKSEKWIGKDVEGCDRVLAYDSILELPEVAE
jgi:hypothetical protein